MPSKFGHERRNKQEKVWKEPSGCGVSKDQTLPFQLIPGGRVRLTRDAFEDQEERFFRAELMEDLGVRFSVNIFTVEFPPNSDLSYKFAFGMDVTSFSKTNQLHIKSASDLFVKVKARVASMLSIHKAYKRDDNGKPVLVFSCNIDELAKAFKILKK